MQTLRDKLAKAGVVKAEDAKRVSEERAAAEREKLAQVDAPRVETVDLRGATSGSPEIGPLLAGEAPLRALRDWYLERHLQGQTLNEHEEATLWAAHFLEVGVDQWLEYERLFEPSGTVRALELYGFTDEARALAAVLQLLATTGRDLTDVDQRWEARSECYEPLGPLLVRLERLFGRGRHVGGQAALQMLEQLRAWSARLT